MENYIPPFEITNEMMMKISSIMEKIGKLDNYTSLNKRPYLRKQNRINSIHSSLAIENNSLSLDQVKDVIDGKTVIGPQKEIQEVKNAYKAYEMITDINPYSINDLLKVHGVDSYIGRLSSIIQGSTDTTIYILGMYFSSVGIKKIRYSLLVGLLADLSCVIIATLVVNIFT